MQGLGRTLVVAGLAIAGLGLLLTFGSRLPFKIGRLPGDIVWEGKNTTFYFPLVTCLLLSLVFTLVTWLFGRRG